MTYLNMLKNKIVVSCQGYKELGNPFFTKEDMLKMVLSVKRAGGYAVRLNSPETITFIKEQIPNVIVVGIWKVETANTEVFITPTFEEAKTLIDLGCEIVAIDGTSRMNRLGQKGYEVIRQVKKAFPNQIIMADLATLEDARESVLAGADIISTTLSGYTAETNNKNKKEPDIELIRDIRKEFPDVYINAEGRVWTIEDVKRAFLEGADVVTIGSAITNPMLIAQRFIENTYIK